MRWKLIYIPLLTWRMTEDNDGSPWMSCWRVSTRHRHGNKSSKSVLPSATQNSRLGFCALNAENKPSCPSGFRQVWQCWFLPRVSSACSTYAQRDTRFTIIFCLSVSPSVCPMPIVCLMNKINCIATYFNVLVRHHSSFWPTYTALTNIHEERTTHQWGVKYPGLGLGKSCFLRQKSPFISETVWDAPKIIMDQS